MSARPTVSARRPLSAKRPVSATRYDVIVIGLGGMGTSAAYHLARRGKRVLGLERFDIPHEYGSSHGFTRIIRLAYFEHPDYVPLLRRAYELWESLEREAGEPLLVRTGSVNSAREDALVFAGSLASCLAHDLPHEVLTAGQVAHRFPGYRLDPDMMTLYQKDGGFLLPERCIVAHVEGAVRAGAEVHGREAVLEWRERGGGVEVRTARGTYMTDRLVITAGAWAGDLVPLVAPVAVPERQILMWMQPLSPELFEPARFPVFNIDTGDDGFYGFPVHGIPGVKLGRYQRGGARIHPDSMDREPTAADEGPLRRFAERFLPLGAGPTLSVKTCIFTNTPDEHFIIDRLPGASRVVVAAGFSGHGFKFASVVGAVLADLAMDRAPPAECGLFRLDRLIS